MLLDTSGLLASSDRRQPRHKAAVEALTRTDPPFLLSPFVLGELDYMLRSRIGDAASRVILRDVAVGAYRLEQFTAEDIAAAMSVMDRYADSGIGLADASIVVLADRYGVTDVLTLDERHFRTLRTSAGQPFRILPADA